VQWGKWAELNSRARIATWTVQWGQWAEIKSRARIATWTEL